MSSENPSDDILIDIDPKGQIDLLSNSLAAPGAITPFHFNDRVDQFFCRALGPGPADSFGREQQAVLLLRQHFVKMQQSRWLQDDCGSQQARRTHPQSTQASDNPIRSPKVGSTLPTTIQDKHLVSHQDGFGNNGSEPTGLGKPDEDNTRMQKKSEDVPHARDGIKLKHLYGFTTHAQFATHSILFSNPLVTSDNHTELPIQRRLRLPLLNNNGL